MKYIGIHLGHDAGVAVFDDQANMTFYAQMERYTRIKTSAFEIDLSHWFPNLPKPTKEDVVAIAHVEHHTDGRWKGTENTCHDSMGYDSQLVHRYIPLAEKNYFSKTIGKNPDFCISHHLAHALSSWCFRKDDQKRLFLSYDGAGFNTEGKLVCNQVGYISNDGIERIDNAIHIPTSIPVVGLLGHNTAGKAMGLAGYMPKRPFSEEMVLQLLKHSLNDQFCHRYPFIEEEGRTDSDLQFVADFYRWYMSVIWNALKENIEKFSGGGGGVIIGGGTALALEINTMIYEMTKDVVFGPPIDDSGCALGAAAFAYYQHNKRWPKIESPSLMDLQDPLPKIGPQEPKDIAKLIHEGKVIALLREKGEAGPRALGYRSLLASPIASNLKLVSQDIKGREFYRPLAPIVSKESFDKLFKGPVGEYMQFLVECTETARSLAPAICHKDNTARPQVVFREKDPWMHELLSEYEKISGIPCLINTSLNKKGCPICNTHEDVQREMKWKPVTLVSIPHPAWKLPTMFI